MKIAISVRILWPGGVQRTAFAEAEGLSKLGHDVHLVFIRQTSRVNYNSKLNYEVLYTEEINRRFIAHFLKWVTMRYNPQRGPDSTVDMDLVWKMERTLSKKFDVVYYVDEFSAFFSKYSKRKYKHKVAVS